MRRTKAQWDIIATQYHSSGLDQQAFCKQHSINLHTFKDVLYKIKKREKNCQFQNNSIKSSSTTNKQQESISWVKITDSINSSKNSDNIVDTQKNPINEIRVLVGNFTILVEGNFEEVAFCKVCKALNGLC